MLINIILCVSTVILCNEYMFKSFLFFLFNNKFIGTGL